MSTLYSNYWWLLPDYDNFCVPIYVFYLQIDTAVLMKGQYSLNNVSHNVGNTLYNELKMRKTWGSCKTVLKWVQNSPTYTYNKWHNWHNNIKLHYFTSSNIFVTPHSIMIL